MLTALLPSFELMDAISSIQSKIIWHFLFPRALSWTGQQPGYMAAADGGHGGWWLTVQGQGDKQALSSVPAIDFSSEVSAWYGSSQGRATKLLAWKKGDAEKAIWSSWPVRIRDMIHALQVHDILPAGNSAECTEASQCFTHKSILCLLLEFTSSC